MLSGCSRCFRLQLDVINLILGEIFMSNLYAGIEAGGTKFICGISDTPGKIMDKCRIPTTSSAKETVAKVIEYFQTASKGNKIKAIGICSFGPLDANPYSEDYGCITTTAKVGWENFNIVKNLKEAFNVPIGFDTDVNGAALGEHCFGAGQRIPNLMYWTVGTGIGAGLMLGGKIGGGASHPEAGHAFVPQDKVADPFEGVCPYHSNCLEGLASGPAMLKRWGVKSATDLPEDHQAWDLEASYIAYAMVNAILTVSPQIIILGGGVMQRPSLYAKIRKLTLQRLGGYLEHLANEAKMDQYIVPPGLGGDSGLHGAIALAEQAWHR